MDQEKIEKKEAKKIMDEFIKELDKIQLTKEFGTKRTFQTRESFENDCESEFRERMFKNAPKERKGFIVAEKKSW